MIAPTVENLARIYNNVVFIKVDVDQLGVCVILYTCPAIFICYYVDVDQLVHLLGNHYYSHNVQYVSHINLSVPPPAVTSVYSSISNITE